MELSNFDFHVPDHLVAHVPVNPRDHARLLIRNSNGSLEHTQVYELPEKLTPGTLLIVNDSRVIPSRLFGKTAHGGRVEVFLLEDLGSRRWRALAKPLKKFKSGTVIEFGKGLCAEVESRDEMTMIAQFSLDSDAMLSWLDSYAHIPLPPYIHREETKPANESPDREIYQTVYAKEKGSVAAPTAGLHFTTGLLDALKERGIAICSVRLHVGAGTFLPVKAEDISQHTMHSEKVFVPSATLDAIYRAKRDRCPVIAVGTTSLRSLESLYKSSDGSFESMRLFCDLWRSTDLFLYPKHRSDRYPSRLVDALWTNFHQPKSTLFMLIAYLLGLDEAHRIYKVAIESEYRLFSYGDASLLWLSDAFHQGI